MFFFVCFVLFPCVFFFVRFVYIIVLEYMFDSSLEVVVPVNPTVNKLHFGHVNILSITKLSETGTRFEEVKHFIAENDLSMLALSETMLDSSIDEDMLAIEGFYLLRKDRKRGAGGVALYITCDMQAQVLMELNIDGIEALWVKLSVSNKSFIFGVCYRPPNQTSEEVEFFLNSMYATFDVLNEMCAVNCPVLLVGDFNDRCELWESNHENSELGLRFHDLLNSFNMSPLIDEPTRGLNILDLVITNSIDSILNVKICDPFDNLDHCPIVGTINVSIKKNKCFYRSVKLYSDENFAKLNECLIEIPWHVLFHENQGCDETVDIYTHILQDEMAFSIPTKEVIIRPRDKPGMTSKVRSLFRKCHRYHKIAQRTKNLVDIENHRIARKSAKKAWREAKLNYDIKMRAKVNDVYYSDKYYWKFMNSVMGGRVLSIPVLNSVSDGQFISVTNDLDKCEAFNDYFASQTLLDFTDEPKLPMLEFKTTNRLTNIAVDRSEVLNYLKQLNVSKATGPDGIGNLVLRSCAESLAEPISYLINKIIERWNFSE